MRIPAFILLAAAAVACGGSDSSTSPPPPANKTTDVFTVEQTFSPTPVNISVGDTVRWNFARALDGLGHNVRFTPRTASTPADIGTQLNPLTSGSQSRVFTTAGTYHYVCDLHGSMVGDIIVK